MGLPATWADGRPEHSRPISNGNNYTILSPRKGPVYSQYVEPLAATTRKNLLFQRQATSWWWGIGGSEPAPPSTNPDGDTWELVSGLSSSHHLWTNKCIP